MASCPYTAVVLGGYWALAENNRARCGVTVHLVHTGGILRQAFLANPSGQFRYLPLPVRRRTLTL